MKAYIGVMILGMIMGYTLSPFLENHSGQGSVNETTDEYENDVKLLKQAVTQKKSIDECRDYASKNVKESAEGKKDMPPEQLQEFFTEAEDDSEVDREPASEEYIDPFAETEDDLYLLK